MSRKSVLLIEDSKLHQSFVRRALEGTYFDLTVVESGIQGLSTLSKKRFDAVVIDLLLPDLSGLSVIRTMRELKQSASTPVLAITSHSSLDFGNDISELNIAAFIEKSSFQPDDFRQQLERALSTKEQRQDIEILLLEPSEEIRHYLRKATADPRFVFSEVLDRSTLESFAATSVPDIIIYAHPKAERETPQWILPYHLDGVIKEVPWIVLFPNQIPKDFVTLADNRLLFPLTTPCSDIVLKKSIEILAQIHQTRISSQEHSLELELACSELEKNRISLTKARSELSHRKDTFGDILLKVGTEVRRPLTSILGYSEALKLNTSDETVKNAADAIANNGRYLAQVVEDVLSIAAIEKGRFQVQRHTFDLLAAVNDLREIARIRARANKVSFVVRIENDIPAEVESDPTLIKQILRGLIDNALKFTTEGSIELKVSYEEELNQLHLVVSDTGPGIPPDKLASILASGSTLAPTTTTIAAGSGFGVSYVRFAAEQLGGNLRVESKAGEGSTFIVSIDPGECSETLSPELAYTILELGTQDKEASPEKISGTALIADVSIEKQKLYRFLLDRTQIHYEFVKDGFETLDRALTTHPDILITDVFQTDHDGLAFIRNLRKRGYAQPILCISAFQFEEQKQRAIDVGCDTVLETPFRVEQFYAALAALMKSTDSEVQGSEVQGDEANDVVETKSEELLSETPETLNLERSIENLPSIPEVILPNDWESNSLVEALVLEFIDMLPAQLLKIESALLSLDFLQAQDAAEELRSAATGYGYQMLAESIDLFIAACTHSDMMQAQHLASHLAEVGTAIQRGRPQVLSSSSKSLYTIDEHPKAEQASEYSASESALQDEINSLFVEDAVVEDEPVSELNDPLDLAANALEEMAESTPANAPTTDQLAPSDTAILLSESDISDEHVAASEIEQASTSSPSASHLEAPVETADSAILAEPTSLQVAAVDTAQTLPPTKKSNIKNPAVALEQVGDALMSNDWQEAATAMEQLLPMVLSLESSPATQLVLKLKVALQTKNIDRSALLIDQMAAVLAEAQAAKSPGTDDATIEESTSLNPTDEVEATHQQTIDDSDAVNSEISALLAELESEVGSATVAQTTGPTSAGRDSRLNNISDTTIFKLFDIEDLESAGEEAPFRAEDDEDQTSKSLESNSPQHPPLSGADEENKGEDKASKATTSSDRLSDDEVEALVAQKQATLNTKAIYSTLAEKEPSTAPLILDFLDELKDLLGALQTAYGRKDSQAMRSIADEVYGSAGICGYDSCAQLARELQARIEEGEVEQAEPLMSEFQEVCEAMFRGRSALVDL